MAVRIAICQRVELSPVEQPEYGIANPVIGVYSSSCFQSANGGRVF